MSIYFYGACHDCKVLVDASNVDLDHAETLTKEWAEKFGHVGHDIQTTSEYDDHFIERTINYENVREQETNKTGACDCPYKRSCHLPRQWYQAFVREKNGTTIETCPFYFDLERIYANKKK